MRVCLCCVLLVFGLAACGSQEEETATEAPVPSEPQAAARSERTAEGRVDLESLPTPIPDPPVFMGNLTSRGELLVFRPCKGGESYPVDDSRKILTDSLAAQFGDAAILNEQRVFAHLQGSLVTVVDEETERRTITFIPNTLLELREGEDDDCDALGPIALINQKEAVLAADGVVEKTLAAGGDAQGVEFATKLLDLNGDEWPDAIAYLRGGACDESGCKLMILAGTPEGFEVASAGITGVSGPIRVAHQRQEGWRFLVTGTGASEAGRALLAYSDGAYPAQASASAGTEEYQGTVIFE